MMAKNRVTPCWEREERLLGRERHGPKIREGCCVDKTTDSTAILKVVTTPVLLNLQSSVPSMEPGIIMSTQ